MLHLHWGIIIHYFVSMLAITNPFGNLAIFIGLTSHNTLAEQRKIAATTALATVIILLIGTWCGGFVLRFLGISVPSFELAGGIIITLLGLSLLQSKISGMSHTEEEQKSAVQKSSIAVVPMSIPIIAGPGALATIILYSEKSPHFLTRLPFSVCDIVIALVIWLVLFFASHISRLLGVSGIKILMRIMGLILVAMAMEMLTSGLLADFPGLK